MVNINYLYSVSDEEGSKKIINKQHKENFLMMNMKKILCLIVTIATLNMFANNTEILRKY